MRFALWIVALFGVAVGLNYLASMNQGYVLFHWPARYEFRLSFNFFLLAAVALMAVLYYTLRGIALVRRLPRQVQGHVTQKRSDKALASLWLGVRYRFEGRAQQSAQATLNSIKPKRYADQDMAAYLMAAEASLSLPETADAQSTLKALASAPPEWHVARDMLLAKWHQAQGRYEEASGLISQVRLAEPKLAATAQLEVQLALQLGKTALAIAQLSALEKTKLVDESWTDAYKMTAYQQQLSTFRDKTTLGDWLKTVPYVVASQADFRRLVAQKWVALAAYDEAIDYSAPDLNAADAYWIPQAAAMSAWVHELALPQNLMLAKAAEQWLAQRPTDAGLLLLLGRLNLAQQLWAKAQSYLEAAVAIAPDMATHCSLVELFAATNQPEARAKQEQALLAWVMQVQRDVVPSA
jgi:HemY protein